jgi:hypothetical protein
MISTRNIMVLHQAKIEHTYRIRVQFQTIVTFSVQGEKDLTTN